MAKILGVFTTMKGKVGNAVMQTWKSVQVMRTRVIPHNPQSAAQTTNRSLFTSLILMFKGIVSDLVTPFWNPFTSGLKTGWSSLLGLNQALQAGSVIDYELVEITHGSLPGSAILTAVYTAVGGDLTASWLDTEPAGSASTDFAMIAAYHSPSNTWFFGAGVEERADESVSVTLPDDLTPADITTYLFFFTGVLATPAIESVSNSNALEASAA